MSTDRASTIVLALFGLNRAGKILYITLFVLAVPAFVAWTVWLPRLRFSDQDERLFKAARHGDRAGVEQALAAGAHVNAAAPIDGKTALFRAAVFGQADAVRVLLEHGADPAIRGNDGQSALEVVTAARHDEKDPAAAGALDSVMAVLREAADR
jgi:hypothetical protein